MSSFYTVVAMADIFIALGMVSLGLVLTFMVMLLIGEFLAKD